MPVRLPTQQYIGVQSLGREDPSGPLRSAGAVATAVQKGLANVAAWADAEAQEGMVNGIAAYKLKTNDLKNSLTQQDTVNIHDPAFKGFEWSEEDRKHFEKTRDPETGQPRTVIAGWRVADRLYDYAEGKIRTKITDDMSAGQRQEFGRQVSGFQIQVANRVVAHRFNGRHAHLKTRFTEAYEQSIANGDEQVARITARNAFKNGAFTIDEYETAMQELGGRIDGNWYNARLNKAGQDGDVEGLEALSHEVWTDPANRMSAEAKIRYQSEAYDEAIRQKSKARTAADKARARASAQKATDILAIIQEQGHQDWGRLADAMVDMEPEDRRTIMTLNASAAYGPQRSDADTVRFLETQIMDLRMPSDVPIEQRAAAVRRLVRQSAITGENTVGTNYEDQTRLYGMVDDATGRQFKDPRIANIVDRIYRVITGADKAAFGPGVDEAAKARVNEVIKDFQRDADAAGDQFQPTAWYEENRDRIEGVNYRGVLQDQALEEASPYIVRDTNRRIDEKASEARILEALDANAITKEQAKKYLNAINPNG